MLHILDQQNSIINKFLAEWIDAIQHFQRFRGVFAEGSENIIYPNIAFAARVNE